jgi:hypothetical protein
MRAIQNFLKWPKGADKIVAILDGAPVHQGSEAVVLGITENRHQPGAVLGIQIE